MPRIDTAKFFQIVLIAVTRNVAEHQFGALLPALYDLVASQAGRGQCVDELVEAGGCSLLQCFLCIFERAGNQVDFYLQGCLGFLQRNFPGVCRKR